MQQVGWTGLSLCGCVGGCRSAPVTGRKQLLLMREDQEIAMGQESFTQVLSEEPCRLIHAATRSCGESDCDWPESRGRPDYAWDFRLLGGQSQNAFCLPGGKVAVYEGILPCVKRSGIGGGIEPRDLACLGATWWRADESESNRARNTIGGRVCPERNSNANRQLFRTAYGAATQYGFILPYSRHHESEAINSASC